MKTILDIALLNCCTYSCDYCISKAHTATAVNYTMPDGTLRGIYATNGQTLKPHILINFIRNHFKPEECFIFLGGGEPLLHDSFLDIAHVLVCQGYKITVNTNANQVKHLDKLAQFDTWKDVKWRCAWHRDFRSIEKFKEDIAPLIKENVLINYIAHPKRIESGVIEQDLADLSGIGYAYEVTPFQGKWNDKDYDKNSKIYEEWITAFKSEKELPGMEVSYLSIIPNGDINRCHRVKVGNIYENSLRERYPQGKQICQFANGNTNCPCVQALHLLGLG